MAYLVEFEDSTLAADIKELLWWQNEITCVVDVVYEVNLIAELKLFVEDSYDVVRFRKYVVLQMIANNNCQIVTYSSPYEILSDSNLRLFHA